MEFKRGKDVMEINRSSTDLSVWEALLEPLDFFTKNKDFLDIICFSSNDEDQQLWVGWCESKIRMLFKVLDDMKGITVRPLPDAFKNPTPAPGRFEHHFFLAITGEDKVDLGDAVKFFKTKVDDYTLKREGMDIEIQHLKRSMLPDFVFPDERRPLKSLKKKERKKTSSKRKAPAGSPGVDESRGNAAPPKKPALEKQASQEVEGDGALSQREIEKSPPRQHDIS